MPMRIYDSAPGSHAYRYDPVPPTSPEGASHVGPSSASPGLRTIESSTTVETNTVEVAPGTTRTESTYVSLFELTAIGEAYTIRDSRSTQHYFNLHPGLPGLLLAAAAEIRRRFPDAALSIEIVPELDTLFVCIHTPLSRDEGSARFRDLIETWYRGLTTHQRRHFNIDLRFV